MTSFSKRLASATVVVGVFAFVHVVSGRTAQDTVAIRGFLPSHAEDERQLEQKLQAIPEAARAESDLRHLTSEPHMAGTEASHRVAEWLRDQFASYGFDAEIVPYSVWLPQPKEIRLELIAPHKKILGSPEPPIPGDADSSDSRAIAAFNVYSPSGDVTAPVVYVNYGMPEDYRALDLLGVSVEGKIAIARYGRGYRGIKTKLAEERKAVGLILYSDPADDGYAVGDVYPNGPWRPMGGIQRGSVLYTQIYPGDPLTSGNGATANAPRILPSAAANLSHIPTMPISAQDASAILSAIEGKNVPREWQGALPFTYHVGPGHAEVHMKIAMDYAQRQLYDVIAKLHGTDDNEWVMLGNHHDAWVFGAADPGSGTAAMLETARSLGELVRGGWKPRRTIVICEWDGEEPGLLGSTEWVETNRAELQAKAVAYVNTDVGVTGPNFAASATPSLNELVRDITRNVQDPGIGNSVYDAWREHSTSRRVDVSGMARAETSTETSGEAPLTGLGAGSDFSPFFDYAGIPALDVSFGGDYGVYHSVYDDFYWMKHFGDPTFAYHVALARVLGTLAVRLDEADILPFDYPAYASTIARAESDLVARAMRRGGQDASLKAVSDAATELTASASRAAQALHAMDAGPANSGGANSTPASSGLANPATVSPVSADAAQADKINRALVRVEQALLAPDGLAGRPWFKHTIYAPGSYSGYSAEILPGITEALDRGDPAILQREADALAAALHRAAAQLNEVTRLAQAAAVPVALPAAPTSPSPAGN
jgi:N-acetylated-alpha-linked acidic dipeptidase